MKRIKLTLNVLPVLILLLHLSFTAFGQAPHLMSYQAVVRDAGNALVVNSPVGVQVSILQGSATGTVVFEETHLVNSNANGLITLEIGNGTNVLGTIAAIGWTNGPLFIKTEIDPAGGTNYSISSTTQLMSVPYAMYAETSGSSIPGPEGPVGPEGPQGPVGPMGPAGPGMAVNCLQCHDHNPATAQTGMAAMIAQAQNEIEYSKHAEGKELAASEGTNASCAPCHSSEGFKSVVDNNVVPAYTLNPTTLKYSYSYNAAAAASSALPTIPTTMGCFTCHKGAATDSMALYTVAPVPMAMWAMPGNSKTIDLTQNNSQSNLCVKCHQPRNASLSSTLSNGASIDYNDLALNPGNMFYDSTYGNAVPNKLVPSYRTGNHYGTVGAIFAGQGAVEFQGTTAYTPAHTHQTNASCQDCHMATPTGITGGHTFYVAYYDESGNKTNNFKGCNKTGCHSNLSASSALWTATRANTLDMLVTIADKLRSGGIEIMHKNPDPESNAYAYLTTEGYDGYLDIYDPSTNATGALRNPAPSNSWTQAQKNYNLTLPKLTSLLNVQMGAIINFQLCLRENSLGVHNPTYTTALLSNTIEALENQGF